MKPPRLRALIVEDDPDTAGVIAEMVSWWDYKVRIAYDAPTALAIAQEFQPEVVLIDLRLGDADGYDVAAALRTTIASRPVRMITISGTDADPARAAATGVEAHVRKPEVGAMLEKLIGRARDQR
jgi:CheY-like chemotaxis protein